MSAVVGVPSEDIVAVHPPPPTFTVAAAGHDIVGLMLSTTVTVCMHVAVLPLPSVTVHVTLVNPSE